MRGLTTAAAIWMSAALGVAAGAGMYVLALGGAVLTLALLLLPHVERLDGHHGTSPAESDQDEGVR